jgi:predicted AAA+ superfamily ATPase
MEKKVIKLFHHLNPREDEDTIQKYIEYAEDTYLIFTVRRYEKKVKQIGIDEKKVIEKL